MLDALDRLGELWGEPMERSRPRREDYAFVAAKSPAEDVLSSNRLASVATPHGHQFPFAFLDIASGLKGSNVPFVHLDIGGAAYSPSRLADGHSDGDAGAIADGLSRRAVTSWTTAPGPGQTLRGEHPPRGRRPSMGRAGCSAAGRASVGEGASVGVSPSDRACR